MNLQEQSKLNAAKSMMKELENEFQVMLGGEQLELNFQGMKTSDYINPTQSSALYLEIDQ